VRTYRIYRVDDQLSKKFKKMKSFSLPEQTFSLPLGRLKTLPEPLEWLRVFGGQPIQNELPFIQQPELIAVGLPTEILASFNLDFHNTRNEQPCPN